ncbi:MAG: hypothetical protein KF819_39635 [Labilithrix sp.]|nr:hypothetical protein [Labilithrix sp.]
MVLSRAACLVAALVAVSAVACSSKGESDEAESQEGAYSQYNPNRGDAGEAGASFEDEAPGIELDDKGFPKSRSVNGFSFGGCEYWPYAVSANPYPDHIVWGCTPGSSPEAATCMAAGMRRLAVILQDPPPQLAQVKEKYRISSFFNWNNDYYGAPESRQGSERIWLYNGSLIKWMSATNRDGTCKLPERSDLVRFLDRCLQGDDQRPGC